MGRHVAVNTRVQNATISANGGTVSLLDIFGASAVGLQILNAFTGTLQFEGTLDPTNASGWFNIFGVPYGGGVAAISTTAAGRWQLHTPGLVAVRVRASAFTPGTDALIFMQGGLSSGSPASVGTGGSPQTMMLIEGDDDGLPYTAHSSDNAGAQVPPHNTIAAGLHVFRSTGNMDVVQAVQLKGENIDFTGVLPNGIYVATGKPSGTQRGDLLRTPKIFKSAIATAAGDTLLWDPASTRSFRLMGYCIEVPGGVTFAAPAILTVTSRENAVALPFAHSFYITTAPRDNDARTPWVELGNGYLAAADANLNINLSAALAGTGAVRVIACGVED